MPLTHAMKRGETRRLTRGEIALAAPVFGPAVSYEKVAIRQIWPLGFYAGVPLGRVIYFGAGRAPRDFSDAPVAAQGLFIHEMAHVWQAARGVFLAAAKVSALGRGAYAYTIEPGKPLSAYNIEAQAEIARHVFLCRLGAPWSDPFDAAALEKLWAQGQER